MTELLEKAKRVKAATVELTRITTEQKNQALILISAQLIKEQDYILEENAKDIAAGRQRGINEPLIDRLTLTKARMKDMSEALIQLTKLEDPVGEVIDSWEHTNGLNMTKVRVPLGVVGMIYEARPNVTVDATSLCIKTGNAILLRGSSSALRSNCAIVKVIHNALEKSNLPTNTVQLIEDTKRDTVEQMLKLTKYLDVLIPRGGAKLINHVVEHAIVPIIETGAGNCHVYIDQTAEPEMAINIAVNSKTQRPSVCNACETILIQKDWAKKYLSDLVKTLRKKGVLIHGDEFVHKLTSDIILATEEDWTTEYLSLEVALKVVENVSEAIDHINYYGTQHSEVIVSSTKEHVETFLNEVDAAVVYHNASSRFTDGFEFGLGAEIGISTQKLHARGPMGLLALTSTKYHVRGTGQLK